MRGEGRLTLHVTAKFAALKRVPLLIRLLAVVAGAGLLGWYVLPRFVPLPASLLQPQPIGTVYLAAVAE